MATRPGLFCAVAIALALIAACSSDGEDSSPPTTTTVTGRSVVEEVTDGSGQDTRVEPGSPVRGGRLVYGIEADTADPWTHYGSSCAISCRMVLRSIADPLFIETADGGLVPYLLAGYQPNEDFTEWTFRVRDGIRFHDGTPMDGPAVAYNINTCIQSPLNGPAFLPFAAVEGAGQTVTLTMRTPYVPIEAAFRTEDCGLMFSPTWLATLPTNPLLSDGEQAEATGDPTAPVGSGAFVFSSYIPGAGNSFIATRNPDYWRGDEPGSLTGEGLPWLDEIEFVVSMDGQGRATGVRSGQFDIIHTSSGDQIARLAQDPELVTLINTDYAETNYVLLNVATGNNPTLAAIRDLDSLSMDPGGLNAHSALVTESCRRALAHAIDRERLSIERHAGLAPPANGPFGPGSAGYLDDSGYPAFDLENARTEMTSCLQEQGPQRIELSLNTTNDAFNIDTNTLIAAMWTEAFGDQITVSISPVDQGQYIGLALSGLFQAQGWRNHGGLDPVEQWFWWSASTASPIDPEAGELAINAGRFQNPDIDAALQIIQTDPDPATRRTAAGSITAEFGDHVYNLWTTWTVWGVVADPRVNNITNLTTPDGHTVLPMIAGKHHLTQIWCTDGTC